VLAELARAMSRLSVIEFSEKVITAGDGAITTDLNLRRSQDLRAA